MRAPVTAFAIIALTTAAAAAQATGYLSAPEARRVFFGIDMRGTHQPSGAAWRECVTPDGKTSYWHAGAYDEGRLTIRQDGALCFSYASSGYRDSACWKVKRVNPTNYRFESVDGDEGVFLTTRTQPAQSCPGRDTPIS